MNGTLYGTTSEGGTGWGACNDIPGCGTVFSFNPAKRAYTVLFSFNQSDGSSPAAALINVNGTLYGTAGYGGAGQCNNYGAGCGTIFSFDTASGMEKLVYSFKNDGQDGANPLGALIAVKGKLYGTTEFGGTHNYGTVFSFDLKTGKEKVLYSFCSQQNCIDGGNPYAGMIRFKGTLYGTTEQGGASDYGTVFSLKP